MGKFSYLFINLTFFFLTYLGLALILRKKISWKYVFIGIIMGFIYFVAVDPFAVVWKAWQYDYGKTLGAFWGPMVIEEFFWAGLAFGIQGIIIPVLAEAEEKGQKFNSLLKIRKK